MHCFLTNASSLCGSGESSMMFLWFSRQPHGHVPRYHTEKRGIPYRPLGSSLPEPACRLCNLCRWTGRKHRDCVGWVHGWCAGMPRSCRPCPCSPGIWVGRKLWRRASEADHHFERPGRRQRCSDVAPGSLPDDRPGPRADRVSTRRALHRLPLWKLARAPNSLAPPPRQPPMPEGPVAVG